MKRSDLGELRDQAAKLSAVNGDEAVRVKRALAFLRELIEVREENDALRVENGEIRKAADEVSEKALGLKCDLELLREEIAAAQALNAKLREERDVARMEMTDVVIQTGWDILGNRPVAAFAADLRRERDAALAKLNSPELLSFRDGVVLEAAHQRERWSREHDAGKTAPDWFWLVGYLAGKALHAHLHGNTEKALHHTISTAAALANWHAAILGVSSEMRPGLGEKATRGVD